MRNVHKTYILPDAPLTKELADLRKGAGLTPAKLADKPTLRMLISKLTDLPLASLTNSQVYAFLIKEMEKVKRNRDGNALYNALGLIEGSKSTLSGRRAAHARQLQKHTYKVERYENQGLAALVAHLINLHPAHTSISSTTITYLQHLEEQAAKSRAATILGLSGLLSLEHGTEELVEFLESSPQPYLDTNIDITLQPSKRGNNWYRMVVSYAFRGRRETFRIAAVTANEDGEQLMKQGLVDEFHKLNDTIEPTREIRSLINNSRFTLRHISSGQQKLLRLKLLTPEQARPLLQSIGQPLRGPCRILEITIPHEWRTSETIYEYYSVINLRDDVHYAYWYAPSLMYVKKLTFDYSRFPNADKWRFTAMPFLGHIAGDALDRDQHSFVLYPKGWIMPGHGIGLAWE